MTTSATTGVTIGVTTDVTIDVMVCMMPEAIMATAIMSDGIVSLLALIDS